MTRGRLLLILLALVLLAEVWLRGGYEKVLRVHLDVLPAMAHKMAANAEVGRRPAPNDLTELLYPLSRARQFVSEYRQHAGRPSYDSFVELVDAYERFVTAADAARATPEAWEAFRPLAAELLVPVDDAAARSRRALAAGS